MWSRAARRHQRRKSNEAHDADKGDEDEKEEEPALGFKVQLLMGKEGSGVEVEVRWLLGRESVLFESFCGMLKRQMGR